MSQPSLVPFGHLSGGRPASVVTLENAALRVRITDYGARLVSIEAPDWEGRRESVVLGFEDAAAYERSGGSFGAVIGRCANRIGGARFTLDGQTHYLVANDGPATLHGGTHGFGKLLWAFREISNSAVLLQLISPDGDEGFPGTLTAQALYRLDGDRLSLELLARTDRPTMVNLSSHPYFNLTGATRDDVLGHELMIDADAFVPTDMQQIPSGALADVSATPFDFRAPRTIGAHIREAHPQLLPGRGYDVCYVLNAERDAAQPVARLRDPRSGRCLEIATTQPGLQLYSGNSLDGSVVGRDGVIYRQSAGVALEASGFPDAPNRPEFPSAVLRPDDEYRALISYRFLTE